MNQSAARVVEPGGVTSSADILTWKIILTPDFINGTFEFLGGLFILNHCRVLYAAKKVAGVSILSTIFFMLWGFWNVFYYPHLEQYWSFAAGLFICAANMLWIALLLKYRKNK